MRSHFTKENIPLIVFMPNFKYGGAEKVLIQVANESSKEGKKTVVAVANSLGELREELNPAVEVIVFNKSKVITCLIPLLRLVKSRGKKEQVQLLTTMYHCNILGCLVKFLNPSIFLSIRESTSIDFYKSEFGKLKLFVFKNISSIFYPMANNLIFPSQMMMDKFREYTAIPAKNCVVIPNPIDRELISALGEEKIDESLWKRKSKNVIVNVGRIDRNKNQILILEALSLIKNEDFEFIQVGDGTELENLKTQAKVLGIDNKVIFLGFQKNPFKFMKGSSIFVLSSFKEGYPNVLIQAKHFGLKIVSTDCPTGPREILADDKDASLVGFSAEQMAEEIRKKLV